jgi:hypothetical protein
MQPTIKQKKITENVINTFLIFSELEITYQRLAICGKNGHQYCTHFKCNGKEYILKVLKSGVFEMLEMIDTCGKYKPIHQYYKEE